LSLINPIVVYTNIPAAAGASQLYWDDNLPSERLKQWIVSIRIITCERNNCCQSVIDFEEFSV